MAEIIEKKGVGSPDAKFKGFEDAIKNLQDDVDWAINNDISHDVTLQGMVSSINTHAELFKDLQALLEENRIQETPTTLNKVVKPLPGVAAVSFKEQLRTEPHSSMETSPASRKEHPLFVNGACKWPNCKSVLKEHRSFLRHLKTKHTFDVKAVSQIRLQIKMVADLALQLKDERGKLVAMMQHLNGNSDVTKHCSKPPNDDKKATQQSATPVNDKNTAQSTEKTIPFHKMTVEQIKMFSPLELAETSNSVGQFRRTRRHIIDDKTSDLLAEYLTRNREIYKTKNIRPPASFMSLIRYAILESPNKQLSLHEIYKWLESTFCYFSTYSGKWKNSVRHYLTMYKCFQRLDSDPSDPTAVSYWTVDDNHFFSSNRRRYPNIKKKDPAPVKPTESTQVTSEDDQVMTEEPSFLDHYRKFPSAQPDPQTFGSSSSNSLQDENNDMSIEQEIKADIINIIENEERPCRIIFEEDEDSNGCIFYIKEEQD